MLKKILAAAAITAALVLGGSSAATAYTAGVTCVANPATIVTGATSVVTCTGFPPNASGTFTVTGPSGTVTTRTITTDAEGDATFSLVGPAAGNYKVTLVTSGGLTGEATVTVTASSAGTGGLPPTGSEVPAAAIWLGVGAIGIGGIAVAAAVARRRAASNR